MAFQLEKLLCTKLILALVATLISACDAMPFEPVAEPAAASSNADPTTTTTSSTSTSGTTGGGGGGGGSTGTAFATNGWILDSDVGFSTGFTGGSDIVVSVAVDGSNRLLIGGCTDDGTMNTHPFLARFSP